MKVVLKQWYKEVQLTEVKSKRHYCTRICWQGWTFMLQTATVVNVQHAKPWQWLRDCKVGPTCEVWFGFLHAQGETVSQIYRKLVLSLCTGNKFVCGAKHSKMAEVTWWTKTVIPSTLISNDNMSCGRTGMKICKIVAKLNTSPKVHENVHDTRHRKVTIWWDPKHVSEHHKQMHKNLCF